MPSKFSSFALQFPGPELSLHWLYFAFHSPASLYTQRHWWGQLLLRLLFFPGESEPKKEPLGEEGK